MTTLYLYQKYWYGAKSAKMQRYFETKICFVLCIDDNHLVIFLAFTVFFHFVAYVCVCRWLYCQESSSLGNLSQVQFKSHIQSSVALPESMTLPENYDTTIFSVKIMHLCTTIYLGLNNAFQSS